MVITVSKYSTDTQWTVMLRFGKFQSPSAIGVHGRIEDAKMGVESFVRDLPRKAG